MIKVIAPASSANLGAGFDCLGLALRLWNTAEMELCDRVEISAADGAPIPTDAHNLVYGAAEELFRRAGKRLPGLRLIQTSEIPMARGLGSSAACIALGLRGGNRLLGDSFPDAELLDIAAALEGHPDNAAPALLGGFTVAVAQDGRVACCRRELPETLRFLAVVPDAPLETSVARAVLPRSVSRADAVYNLSRASLFTAALFSGEFDKLRVACGDRLHQPWRLALVEGGEWALDALRQAGAYAEYLSGAGSTLMGVFPAERAQAAAQELSARLGSAGRTGWRVLQLTPDNAGARVL